MLINLIAVYRMLRIISRNPGLIHTCSSKFACISSCAYFVTPCHIAWKINNGTKVLFLHLAKMPHYLCLPKPHGWCHGSFSYFSGRARIFFSIGKNRKIAFGDCLLYLCGCRQHSNRNIYFILCFIF